MQHERGDMGIAKADAGAATYLDDDQVLVQRPPGLIVGVVLHQALQHPLELRDQRHAVLLRHLSEKVIGQKSKAMDGQLVNGWEALSGSCRGIRRTVGQYTTNKV